MTTTVTVKTYDWEVLIIPKSPKTKKISGLKTKVSKNSQQDFYVHSNQSLYIKEIRPRKLKKRS